MENRIERALNVIARLGRRRQNSAEQDGGGG
jgi:hypothetical protein